MAAAPPPLVSVIVPVRDQARAIQGCLAALEAQSYPRERYEVLVVDNDSVDETRARVRARGVRLLLERAPGPYAARNTGVAHAGGEVLAFTDADCVPEKDWLARGVEALEREGAGLAAGGVVFRCSEPPRLAEVIDALQHLDHEARCRQGLATTGNLFVRREVLDEIGSFRPWRSGADGELCQRALGAGHALVYAPEARVEKRARGLGALLAKKLRVGRGHVVAWRRAGVAPRECWRRTLRCFRPPRRAPIDALFARRAPAGAHPGPWAVWLGFWLATACQGLGRLRALLRRAPAKP